MKKTHKIFEPDFEAVLSFIEISATINKISVTHIVQMFRHSDILFS